MAGVSERDKERMRNRQAAFKEAEVDEYPTPDQVTRHVASENDRRSKAGEPPMVEERDTDPPEAEFFRRARALGLSRRRG